MMKPKVLHAVVDSGAFIKNAQIQDIADNVYTLPDVVAEIRDKATRDRLQILPYELHFKEPSPEATKSVSDFAKKTGDYRSLSAVDLRVIALVYQLESEKVGRDHIKTSPQHQVTWTSTSHHLEKSTEIAGFYIPKQNCSKSELPSEQDTGQNADQDIVQDTEQNIVHKDTENKDTEHNSCQEQISEHVSSCLRELYISDAAQASTQSSNDEQTVSEPLNTKGRICTDEQVNREPGNTDNGQTVDQQVHIEVVDTNDDGRLKEGDVIPDDQLGDDSEDEEEGDDGDDDDGWITPQNVKDMRRAMGDSNVELANVQVGCITTDFAMQNVLIQMGLNVISVDGMLIKYAKNYVFRCFACFKITMDMTKEFCYHCGNKTLQKVSMTVAPDGSKQFCLSRRRPISTRGMQFTLPAPKGGKHARNPILCADQREAQQRAGRSGSRAIYDVFSADYAASESPFAPTDISSRSALLGIRGQKNPFARKRNPNENRKVYGRRK